MRVISLSLVIFFCAVLGYSSGVFESSPEFDQTLLQDQSLHDGLNKVLAKQKSDRSLASLPVKKDLVEEVVDTDEVQETDEAFEQVRTMSAETQEQYIASMRHEMQQDVQILRQMKMHGGSNEASELQAKIENKQALIDQLREEQLTYKDL